MTNNSIPTEDLNDIVGRAAEIMMEDEGRLSIQEMHEIGAEFDIPSKYMERARRELEESRRPKPFQPCPCLGRAPKRSSI